MNNILRYCKSASLRAFTALIVVLSLVSSAICADPGDKFKGLYDNYQAQRTQSLNQIDKDYELLQIVCEGIDHSHVRFQHIQSIMESEELFPPALEMELVNVWATYLRQRKVLLTITNRYSKPLTGTKELDFGPTLQQKEILLSYSSSLFLFSSTAKITGSLKKPSNRIWKRLDEANSGLDICDGELSSQWRKITTVSSIRKMAEAQNAYFNAYPEAKDLAEAGVFPANWLHNRVLHEMAWLDDNSPRLWREKLKQLWQTITTGLHKPYYNIFSAISIWVGDTKYLKKPPAIQGERINEMIGYLQPGDILLERENWYLSNAFLPGFWPHGIIYTGTENELRELGLHEDPRVSRHLKAYGKADKSGHFMRVVESISEGVVMNTMEHATDADYICAFRPNVALEERKEAIARAFGYIGKPYDFDFDFLSADKIVCTELLYRSYGHIIKFDVEHVAGKPVVQGTGIINKFSREINTEAPELNFIFFLDSDSKTSETWFATEDDLIKSNSRKGLAFLNRDNDVEE